MSNHSWFVAAVVFFAIAILAALAQAASKKHASAAGVIWATALPAGLLCAVVPLAWP
jgi:hypothetical protein